MPRSTPKSGLHEKVTPVKSTAVAVAASALHCIAKPHAGAVHRFSECTHTSILDHVNEGR